MWNNEEWEQKRKKWSKSDPRGNFPPILFPIPPHRSLQKTNNKQNELIIIYNVRNLAVTRQGDKSSVAAKILRDDSLLRDNF